jgi:hypothetical protein
MVQDVMSILTPAPEIRDSLNITAAQVFDMAFVEIREFVGVISLDLAALLFGCCRKIWYNSKTEFCAISACLHQCIGLQSAVHYSNCLSCWPSALLCVSID